MLGLALAIPNSKRLYVSSNAEGARGRHWLAGAKVINFNTPGFLPEASSA